MAHASWSVWFVASLQSGTRPVAVGAEPAPAHLRCGGMRMELTDFQPAPAAHPWLAYFPEMAGETLVATRGDAVVVVNVQDWGRLRALRSVAQVASDWSGSWKGSPGNAPAQVAWRERTVPGAVEARVCTFAEEPAAAGYLDLASVMSESGPPSVEWFRCCLVACTTGKDGVVRVLSQYAAKLSDEARKRLAKGTLDSLSVADDSAPPTTDRARLAQRLRLDVAALADVAVNRCALPGIQNTLLPNEVFTLEWPIPMGGEGAAVDVCIGPKAFGWIPQAQHLFGPEVAAKATGHTRGFTDRSIGLPPGALGLAHARVRIWAADAEQAGRIEAWLRALLQTGR